MARDGERGYITNFSNLMFFNAVYLAQSMKTATQWWGRGEKPGFVGIEQPS